MKSILAILAVFATFACHAAIELERIKLPPGFEITVFAQVPGARSMALGDKGTLFVGTRGSKVYAVKHDGRKATEVVTLTLADLLAGRR